MKREFLFYLGAIVALFLLLLTWLFSTPEAIARFAAPEYRGEAAVVKIVLKDGHGSGFIYNGRYIVTAAHVVGTEPKVKYKGVDGVEREAEVLWANKAYDVALLAVEERLPSAQMTCREAAVGETVVAKGNPLAVEFIQTEGKIAGSARAMHGWRSVYVADLSAAGGMSGGPVFDSEGNVIGITVGGVIAPMGFGGSFVGLTFLVPSSAICGLLAMPGGEPA